MLGDLNVREEEVAELCEVCGVVDAPYERTSWNPAVNPYHGAAARSGPLAHGHRFDKVLFGGEAFAAVYPVGQSRFFRDGAEFYLSDHFGLLGLVDVHSDFSGRAGSGAIRVRRQEVGRQRDTEVLVELQTVRERQQVDRAEAALIRVRPQDGDRGELSERLRQVQRQERLRRQAVCSKTAWMTCSRLAMSQHRQWLRVRRASFCCAGCLEVGGRLLVSLLRVASATLALRATPAVSTRCCCGCQHCLRDSRRT